MSQYVHNMAKLDRSTLTRLHLYLLIFLMPKHENKQFKLDSTHRVQTSANAVRYPRPTPLKRVINIHPQLFQFVFNA